MPTPARTPGAVLLGELERRDLLHDHTDRTAIEQRLDESVTALYCGFDPTADSLHIGNLQSLMLLQRFQEAGHAPIALVGGATGMIGDPSGRSDERQFLDPEVLDHNRTSIGAQLERFLDFGDGANRARLVDNRSWTENIGVLEFLRDVGKHMTINTMLAKDSVKSRIARESGISFTEFSYMLLQANDYLELHREHGCDLQVAGSDQWGNITAGIDLIRRRTGDTVHGLTAPLITRSDGTKFGKSEGENIWLSADRTSPWRLYQYLLNVGDHDVGPLLLRLSTVDVDEIESVVAEHLASPERRSGQRRLARAVTGLVHGSDVIEPIEQAADVVFGRPIAAADERALELLSGELPSTSAARDDVEGSDVLEWLVRSGLAKSKGDVRRNPTGYSVNQTPLSTRADSFASDDLLYGRFVLLRRGKSTHHLLVIGG